MKAMRGVRSLNYSALSWGDEEAVALAKLLASSHASSSGEAAADAAPALEKLYLYDNRIGDAGMRALAEALRAGAAPALAMVNARGNPGDGAVIDEVLRSRVSPASEAKRGG